MCSVQGKVRDWGATKGWGFMPAAVAGRTWVLLTESPEGGWGVAGHANTGSDLAQAARAELAAKAEGASGE